MAIVKGVCQDMNIGCFYLMAALEFCWCLHSEGERGGKCLAMQEEKNIYSNVTKNKSEQDLKHLSNFINLYTSAEQIYIYKTCITCVHCL